MARPFPSHCHVTEVPGSTVFVSLPMVVPHSSPKELMHPICGATRQLAGSPVFGSSPDLLCPVEVMRLHPTRLLRTNAKTTAWNSLTRVVRKPTSVDMFVLLLLFFGPSWHKPPKMCLGTSWQTVFGNSLHSCVWELLDLSASMFGKIPGRNPKTVTWTSLTTCVSQKA